MGENVIDRNQRDKVTEAVADSSVLSVDLLSVPGQSVEIVEILSLCGDTTVWRYCHVELLWRKQ